MFVYFPPFDVMFVSDDEVEFTQVLDALGHATVAVMLQVSHRVALETSFAAVTIVPVATFFSEIKVYFNGRNFIVAFKVFL